VYYVPSHNEPDWDKLPADKSFLRALDKRKEDLPPVKEVL
jgi:hypothetical protein